MQIDLTINKGRGYVISDENRIYCDEINMLPIDSIYTPIRNVKYKVEDYRVEQKTDYESLTLEVTTDGSIHPKDALKEAARILIYHFGLFSDEKMTLENAVEEDSPIDEVDLRMRKLLKSKLTEMNLSVRALNCLAAANVETLGDLVQYNKNDLLKFRNFGKKSLSELENLLASQNLTFGMDIAKYKLEKEEPYTITKEEENVWSISGKEVERIFKMTKFNNEEAIYRFAKKLKRLGIDDKLASLGAKEGDQVRILDFYFDYKD